MYERRLTHDRAGPLHHSCMLYAAMVCPYLRERNARLGKASTINPGGKRGTRAAALGFQDFGVMMYAGPPLGPDMDPRLPMIAYMDLEEDIHYRDGSELVDRYAAGVEADSAIIDM